MAEGINLAALPPLDVVKQVDYETIVADVTEKAGITNASPSDPAYRVALAGSYRETLLRQDANDQARGLMLAYASGSQLDHIGVTYYRNADGSPVVRLAGEDDDDYKARLQESPEGLSVAGPDGAYRFHARSAHPDVKDVSVASPAPVEVVISILSNQGKGEADSLLLDAVTAYLGPVRPLTDKLSVVSATVKSYSITATLSVAEGPDPSLVLKNAIAALQAYTEKNHKLGGLVVQSGIDAALTVEGVLRVRLSGWSDAAVACDKTQAPYCTGLNITIGEILS